MDGNRVEAKLLCMLNCLFPVQMPIDSIEFIHTCKQAGRGTSMYQKPLLIADDQKCSVLDGSFSLG